MREISMGNKLILHIGMPKTGSTSLQRFLEQNNDVLKKHSFCYPDARMNFNNTKVEIEGRWQNGGLKPYESFVLEKDDVWKEAYEKFTEIVSENLNNYNVILSDESIWTRIAGTRYIRYLKKIFKNIIVIVYIRRQDFWLESMWAQKIKLKVLPENLDTCNLKLKDYCEKTLSSGIGYYDKLQQIEGVVGKDNLKVFSYEEAKEYGVYRHFVENIGLDYGDFNNINNQNVSNSVIDIEIKRQLNSSILDKPYGVIQRINEEYWKLNIFFDEKKGYFMDGEERTKILSSFENDNKKVAMTYFNREELFDKKVDYPKVNLVEEDVNYNYCTLIENMITKFAFRLDSQLEYIKSEKVIDLEVSNCLDIISNSNIAVWGARDRGEYALSMLKRSSLKDNIVGIYDSDCTLWNGKIEGETVRSPETLFASKIDNLVVVLSVAPLYHMDIDKRLAANVEDYSILTYFGFYNMLHKYYNELFDDIKIKDKLS
jgi:hypothetical protein